MMNEVQLTELFEIEFKSWGLRGDPCLFDQLKQEIIEYGAPSITDNFEKLVVSIINSLATTEFINDDTERVSISTLKSNCGDDCSHNGMSEGQVSAIFWNETAIPTLLKKHKEIVQKDDYVYVSRMETPDGTMLISRSQHDYSEYIDANGDTYILDGGSDYQRISINKVPMIDRSIRRSDGHEVIRQHVTWGSYGKDGTEPLHFIAVKDLEDEHIQNILTNCSRSISHKFKTLLEEEQVFRKQKTFT
ncbi:hypothetical protein VCHA53O466_40123 [Vibrio chagasii]|nr:hypothetical protein VCHA53O466_40123 [Vibrio chagasii]